MARIRTYGLDSNIDPADKIIGTDGTPGPNQGDTKNFSVSALVSYIDNEIGAVDGSGTLNTIPMWTPDGDTLGDSIILKDPSVLSPDEGILLKGKFRIDTTGTAVDIGVIARFSNEIVFTKNLYLEAGLKDGSFSLGTAGQILSSTGTATQWVDGIPPNNVIGSGTVNTMAMFTPDGSSVGDSLISQTIQAPIGSANNVVTIDGGNGNTNQLQVNEVISSDISVTDTLTVTNITGQNSGTVTINGNTTLGNEDTDTTTINSTLAINSIVQDSNQALGTDGQLLVSNEFSELLWQDFATLVPNNITGSGTVEYIPKFTPDGTAVGNSIMFTKPNGTEIQVGVLGAGNETTLGAGFMTTTGFSATTVTATNINAGATGTLTASGNIILGDATADTTTINSTLIINSVVQDSNQALGTDGQILVANEFSELLWQDQDGDTTYTYSSAQTGSDVVTRLTDGVTNNDVTLVAGNSISLTDDGSNNITIAATGGAANTTYDLDSIQTGSDVAVTLVGSDATLDTLTLVAGNGLTLTDDGSNNITFATASGNVTGSGTLSTIPLWTPDGQTLGNSNITQGVNGGIRIQAGLTDATEELKVAGISSRIVIESIAAGDAHLEFRPNVSSNSAAIFELKPTSPSSHFAWTELGSELMRLNGAGNLGLGVTNPVWKVQVEGANAFRAQEGLIPYFQVFKAFNRTYLDTNVDGGTIYIGAPTVYTQNLQVQGTGRFEDGIIDTNTSTGVAGQVLTSTGSDVEWIDNTSLVAGTDIDIVQNGSQYTINSTATTVNTTYTLDGEATAAGETYTLQLNGSDTSQETIVLQAGANISFSGEDENGITINSTDNTPTLTDYEEGIWTPDMKTYLTNILNPINGLDFDTQTGKYIKINDKVFCEFKIRYKLLPTYSWPANEYLVVTGLPFTPEGSIRNSNLSGNINRLSSFNSTNADELPRLLSNACTPFYDVITPTGMGLLPPQNTNSGTKPLLVTLFSDQDDYTGGNYVEFYGSFTYTTI